MDQLAYFPEGPFSDDDSRFEGQGGFGERGDSIERYLIFAGAMVPGELVLLDQARSTLRT